MAVATDVERWEMEGLALREQYRLNDQRLAAEDQWWDEQARLLQWQPVISAVSSALGFDVTPNVQLKGGPDPDGCAPLVLNLPGAAPIGVYAVKREGQTELVFAVADWRFYEDSIVYDNHDMLALRGWLHETLDEEARAGRRSELTCWPLAVARAVEVRREAEAGLAQRRGLASRASQPSPAQASRDALEAMAHGSAAPDRIMAAALVHLCLHGMP